MLRTYLLPVLSVVGFFFAVWLVFDAGKPVPASNPVTDPPEPPYALRISGSGIVEASTRNIAIGTHVSGVVTDVKVRISDFVEAGTPLFAIDDRVERAALAIQEASLAEADARLSRLLRAPRSEEIPVARAKVSEAEASLQDLRHQLARAEEVGDPRAISIEDLTKRRFAVHAATARLAEAKANLVLLEAGSWEADIAIARAEVNRVTAQVYAALVAIERLTIRAPVDGHILQVNIRPGEFALSGVPAEPLVLLGDIRRLHVRVDVDENDAWRFAPRTKATAFVRGNPRLKTDLSFEYREPYVIPKRSLTGDSTERVDTRVMQLVYSFPADALNVYPGQLMDVYIEDLEGSVIPPASPSTSGDE